MGGAQNFAKTGESQTGSVSFLSLWKINSGNLKKVAPLSLIYFGRFSFRNSALFIHGPSQTGSQPMSGRLYMLPLLMLFKYAYNIINTIVTHNVYIILFLAPLFLFRITGFCLTGNCNDIQ